MRLCLTIHRQSLPTIRVLWTGEGLRLGQSICGENSTISQLLEQVNEVIPLEAEDWGLEDYIVEVRGYECFHFSRLDQILRDEDEVTIRPLQAIDLRYRKISGRHQISGDGKHLIDGVAFGRPFFRQTDRPRVRIPPRKRIKLTPNKDQEEDDAEDSLYSDQQIALRKSAPDTDESLETSDTEEDSVFDTEGLQIPTSELIDITNDIDDSIQSFNEDRSLQVDRVASRSDRATRSWRRRQRQQQGLGLQGERLLGLVDENDRLYPGEYQNPLLEQYYQEEFNPLEAKGNGVSRTQDMTNHMGQSKFTERASRRSSSFSSSMKSVRSQEDLPRTPATVLEVDDSEDSDDEDFEPGKEAEDNSSESNKENVKPNRPSLKAIQDLQESDDSSTASSDTESVGSITSSDTDSVSSGTSSSLSSSSTSSSDDDSSADLTTISSQQHSSVAKSSQPPAEQCKKDASMMHQNHNTIPPGSGQRRTHARNRRRRKLKVHIRERAGISPLDTGSKDVKGVIGDVHTLEHPRSSISMELSGQPTSATSSAVEVKRQVLPESTEPTSPSTLEVKRQALLDSIASGGVEVEFDDVKAGDTEMTLSNTHGIAPTITPDTTLFNPMLESQRTDLANTFDVPVIADPVLAIGTAPSRSTTDVPPSLATFDAPRSEKSIERPASEPAKRRTKLNLASSRRLLFGSLGYRAPKTKADEDNLREKLMKHIKPVPQVKDESSSVMINVTENGDANDDWRDKIILKAVECCQEGVELSVPPFPFVQRWDPQQRGSQNFHMRETGGRGTKRKRNQKQLLKEDSIFQHGYDGSIDHQEAGSSDDTGESNNFQPTQKDFSRKLSGNYQVAVDEQIMRDEFTNSADKTHGLSPRDDLPNLPADLSTIPDLSRDNAIVGAIITFKQLEMSETTNWQPQVSNVRTAIIDRILEDGKYEMTLAQRDRPQKYRYYDDETGERIYPKFEIVQDDDGEDDGNENLDSDSGFVELALEEMIEPKLLKVAKSEKHIHSDEKLELSMGTNDLSNAQSTIAASGIVKHPEDNENVEASKSPLSRPEDELHHNLDAHDTIRPQLRREPLEVTEDTRKEISMLMKDAGFRSDVHSEIDQGLMAHNHDNSHLSTHRSVSQESLNSELPSKLTSFNSSPPPDQSSRLGLDPAEPINDSASLLDANIFEVPETQFLHEALSSEQYGRQQKELESGDLCPTSDENNKSFHIVSSPPPNLVLSSPKELTLLKKSVSPPLTAAQASAIARKVDIVHSIPHSRMSDGANSDSSDDFPSVEKIFSTQNSISMSQNGEEKPDQKPRRSSPMKNGFSHSQRSHTKSQPHRVSPPFTNRASVSSSAKSNNKGSGSEFMSAQGRSQIPLSSQIVNLTISSDAADAELSELEERSLQSLPSGPGWVKKIKKEKPSFTNGLNKSKRGASRKMHSM